ncbi:MAG: flagellar FliJ protein [Alphaproteobacteria bacterium]|jgi:flagellar FliJ protein
MSSIKQLLLVATVEQKREQTCALQYQQANAHLQANQQKLSGLEQYRLDYMHSIRAKAAKGIGAKSMNQYHQFITQLDKACEQQVRVISQSVLVVDQRKRQWLAQQQKHKAIIHLVDVKKRHAKQTADKQEQKLFDEIALQRAIRKPHYQ